MKLYNCLKKLMKSISIKLYNKRKQKFKCKMIDFTYKIVLAELKIQKILKFG